MDRQGWPPQISGSQVERSLLQCVKWSRMGRHRRVLNEVERILPAVADRPQLLGQVLIWKAHALLAMSCSDRALSAATQSWEMEASPHACHLMANSLCALGDQDQSEQLLRLGWHMFPDAVHLQVQLAMLLADQGRLSDALDALDELTALDEQPQDLQVFVFGLRANLLATNGRWAEASELLQEGINLHPDSLLLYEAHDSLTLAWSRSRSEQELTESWSAALAPLDGVAGEVDDAIVRCATITERSRLQALAARRLWRAYLQARPARPQSPDPWAAAALLAVASLDGDPIPASVMARSIGVVPQTVRSALRRLRSYLDELQPEFARRFFAAHANPRLDECSADRQRHDNGSVVEFPARRQA